MPPKDDYHLSIVYEDRPAVFHPLANNSEGLQLIIGRGQHCDIEIDDRSVSGRHLKLDCEKDNAFYVTDLGSPNGTTVDGVKLSQNERTPFAIHSVIEFKKSKLQIQKTSKDPDPMIPMNDEDIEITQPIDGTVSSNAFNGFAPPSSQTVVEVSLYPNVITIPPGEEGQIMLVISNGGNQLEEYTVTVFSLPVRWVQILDGMVRIRSLPNAESGFYFQVSVEGQSRMFIPIRLAPRKHWSNLAGTFRYEVQVQSYSRQGYQSVQTGRVVITPFSADDTGLESKYLTRTSTTRLVIANLGNISTGYRVEPIPDFSKVQAYMNSPKIQIEPGRGEKIPIRFEPIQRPLLGRSSSREFQLQVTNLLTKQVHIERGALTVHPVLNGWVLLAGMLLFTVVTVGIVLTGMVAAYVERQEQAAATATQVAAATATQFAFATVTQAAAATQMELSTDRDGDGLPLAEEIDLGTSPNNPDTDGDGVEDGVDENPLATPDTSTPDFTVKQFYDALNADDYASAHALLSPNFKAATNTRSRANFDAFWGQFANVDVVSIRIIEVNGDTACLFAEIIYEDQFGNTFPDQFPFINLVKQDGQWLIDSKQRGAH